MEIVFFWIEEYRNLKNIGVNFGSEHVFEVNDNKVTCKVNEGYIENFFSLNGQNNILNISAIVGMNASGKSNLLNAIRIALDKNISKQKFGKYCLIFKNNNKYYIRGYFSKIANCKSSHISPGKVQDFNYIFHAPTFEVNTVPNTPEYGIDVSSDFLASQEVQNLHKGIVSPLEFHKHRETMRQIDFLREHRNVLPDNFYIPAQLSVISSLTTGTVFDINYSQMGATSKLSSSTYIDEDFITLLEYISQNRSGYEEHLNAVLFQLTYNICTFINAREEELYRKNKVKKRKNSSPLDQITSFQGNSERFFLHVINKQKYFEAEPIISFWEYLKKLHATYRFKSRNEAEASIKIPFDRYEEFYNTEQHFLEALGKNYKFNLSSFFEIDWHGMSKGAKAYLNLFSRLFLAKNKVLKEMGNDGHLATEGYPSSILILIDEGEDGFHLQWQKEYITNMIKYFPKILSNDGVCPNIQIIFTTHSPISLSDIPNDRITYLKDGKVLMKYERPKTSFADNIHSLMSHTFFQKDDLAIGHFAKSKIENVINFLKTNYKSSKKYGVDMKTTKVFIDQIGEDIIRDTLLELWHEKQMKLKKQVTISDKLLKKEAEIKELKETINKLRNEA